MDEANTREYSTQNLIDELTEIGLLSEKEAVAYVYCDIRDDKSVNDVSDYFNISEKQAEHSLTRARNAVTAAKKTREVLSNDYSDIDVEIAVLNGAGLLPKNQAESYTHHKWRGGNGADLEEILDRSANVIEHEIEIAERTIDKARRTVSFLVKYPGIHIYENS